MLLLIFLLSPIAGIAASTCYNVLHLFYDPPYDTSLDAPRTKPPYPPRIAFDNCIEYYALYLVVSR